MLNSYPETNGPVSRLIPRSGLQSISSEQASLEPPKIRKRGYITLAFCRATVPATADAAVFDDIRHGIAQASGGRFVHWPSLKNFPMRYFDRVRLLSGGSLFSWNFLTDFLIKRWQRSC